MTTVDDALEAAASVDISDEQTTLGDLAAWFPGLAAAGAVLCVAGLGIAWAGPHGLRYFFHAYLVNYCFFLSISLGGLFFVALQHVTRAGWSVTVRRLSEIMAANVGLLAMLFLPIAAALFLGRRGLYAWADSQAAAGDELLEHKAPYLNTTFFLLRSGLYLGVWWLLARFFLRRSLEQDRSGDPALTVRMERAGPAALVLFAVSVTFAAFDWLMSLDPHWFSTIFGLYYSSGAIVGTIAALVLAAVFLQSTGRLTSLITVEHYHDLGKLLFAFVVFWGYIAFSQYLLTWYGNIPEETTWYQDRQVGVWATVSLGLWFGNLLIPFFGLLCRRVKRQKAALAFWAVWLLVFHWIDVYWLVMPTYWRDAIGHGAGGRQVAASDVLPATAVDLCLLAGLGALYLAGLLRVAGDRSLAPLKDPRLAEALEFENL